MLFDITQRVGLVVASWSG